MPLPPAVVDEWLQPFLDYLAKERRYSPYTVRNYRQAFEDFYAWLVSGGRAAGGLAALTPRDMRDFVIEAQRRFERRTLHNHVSGLRSFFRFWMQRGKLARNPFAGVPLPKLEQAAAEISDRKADGGMLGGPQQLLQNETLDAFTAWRDRLVLELLYGGGLRVSELVGLNYGAIDLATAVCACWARGARNGSVRSVRWRWRC